jgi:replicative DNA helicase
VNTAIAPHDIEAEEATLGAILINPDMLATVKLTLRPRDFFLVKHQWIFEAMLALDKQRLGADNVTVASELEKQPTRNEEKPNLLLEVGGPAYLTYLINSTPFSANTESHVQLVAQTSTRRRTLDAIGNMARLMHDETVPLDEAVGTALKAFQDATRGTARSEGRTYAEIAAEVYDELERAYLGQGEIHDAISSGFSSLDKMLLAGGFEAGFNMIAGRPSQGKSTLLLNIAENMAAVGKHVLFFSFEVGDKRVYRRTLASEVPMDGYALRRGDFGAGDWEEVIKTMDRTAIDNIKVYDRPGMTPAEVRRAILSEEAGCEVDAVFIDYLGKMHAGRDIPRSDRLRTVSQLSNDIQEMALELGKPFIVAHQLSRQGANVRPELNHLRDSGEIEQDIDVCIGLYRQQGMTETELLFLKQRDGRTGKVALEFDGPHTRFIEPNERGHGPVSVFGRNGRHARV